MTIDPVLIAAFSALAAAVATIWNIVWTVRKNEEARRERLATLMLNRSERLKQKVATYVGLINRITFQMSQLNTRGDQLPDAAANTQQIMTLQTEIGVELDLANTVDRFAFAKLQEVSLAGGIDDGLAKLQSFKDAIGGVLSEERNQVDKLLAFEKHLKLEGRRA